MAEFTIETTDSVYSYDVSQSTGKTANISFEIDDNASFSDTQGYLRKKQIGDKRVKAKVTLVDTKTRIENNIYPMIDYQSNVNCTFDRNIPLQNDATATFVLEKVRLIQELAGNEHEIELNLTEVINP